MKRFVYRLQTALDHRERIEEQRRSELGRLQQRLHEEIDRLRKITNQRAREMSLAQAERVGRLSPTDAEIRERFLERLTGDMEEQRNAIRLVEREVERKLQEVVIATQETQALENLRVRHLQEYKAEELREEQKFMDEIASIRATKSAARD